MPGKRETALHIAASNGYSEIVKFLVRSGASLNARDSLGQTALIKSNSNEQIQFILLEAGADPNIKGIDDNTALHYAAHFGFVKVVRKLVESGADVNACNKLEQNPLWLACAGANTVDKNSVVIAKILLESSASPNTVSKVDGTTPFHEVIRMNRPNLVDVLLERGADIMSQSGNGLYPLQIAAELDSALVLEKLLPLYTDPDIQDTEGDTALHHAIEKHSIPCIEALVSANSSLVSPDNDGFSPMHGAFAFGSTQVVETLLKAYFDRKLSILQVDASGNFLPVHFATNPEMVRLWVEADGPINWTGSDKESILHIAIFFSGSDVIEAFIKHGADIKCTNKLGMTPIEKLCSVEEAWTTKSGGLSSKRLGVLQVLLKHTPLTPKCRNSIKAWKNLKIRVALTQKLPWRSISEIARGNVVPITTAVAALSLASQFL